MFFLYHNRSYRTGRILARTLNTPYARAARRVPAGLDVLIRWGNAQPAVADTEVNSAAAINNASDKLRCFQRLEEAGISIPQVFSPAESIGSGNVLFGRSRRGFGGRDIAVYQPESVGNDEAAKHDFFTAYIEPKFEARIHVAFGEVIRVQKKYLDYPDDRQSEYIRNYANGYRFKSPTRELNASRKEAAIAAVCAVGLDFGAVDLIVGMGDNKEYVLEINTAPKCSPLTGAAYVEAIAGRLGIEPRLDLLEALNG